MPNDPAPAVELVNLTRRFGEATALDDVSLAIRSGEFFSLLGPSGCGKTTLLRVVAGLEVADAGTVRIEGVVATGLPAHRRPVNTVFQSYALFPHMNVRENVGFGLRMKKVPRPEIERRVAAVLALVEIGDLGARRPAELSGGQKQRVALARAIVNEPRVLLLDEPLAALDLKLRQQLQGELRKLQRRLGITFVYVTHDQHEALVMSDRIALMRHGRIEQVDDARALYERPRTRFASQFLGACSLIEAKLRQTGAGEFLAETALGDLWVSGEAPPRPTFTLAIRPERVALLPTATGGPNAVRVRIEQATYAGAATQYELRAGAQTLRAEAMNTGAGAAGFAVGDEATAQLPPKSLMVLDD